MQIKFGVKFFILISALISCTSIDNIFARGGMRGGGGFGHAGGAGRARGFGGNFGHSGLGRAGGFNAGSFGKAGNFGHRDFGARNINVRNIGNISSRNLGARNIRARDIGNRTLGLKGNLGNLKTPRFNAVNNAKFNSHTELSNKINTNRANIDRIKFNKDNINARTKNSGFDNIKKANANTNNINLKNRANNKNISNIKNNGDFNKRMGNLASNLQNSSKSNQALERLSKATDRKPGQLKHDFKQARDRLNPEFTKSRFTKSRFNKYRTKDRLHNQERFLRHDFRGHNWHWWYNNYPATFFVLFPLYYNSFYGYYPPIYYDYYDLYGYYPTVSSYISSPEEYSSYSECEQDCMNNCIGSTSYSLDDCQIQCASACS